MPDRAPRVLVRCDVGPTMGIGHLMRCIALSEEFLARGYQVVYAADARSVPWAAAQLERRGIPIVDAPWTPEDHVALVKELEADIVVIDSYVLGASVYAELRAAGIPVLALVDDKIGDRVADIFLDQNIDAEKQVVALPEGVVRLAGLRYALLRNEVLDGRPGDVASHVDHDPVRVLAVFGGTDAFGAGPVVAGVLARVGVDAEVTIVAGGPEQAAAIRRVRFAPQQLVNIIPPTDRLVEHVLRSDVVLSAAGSSTWELLGLGAATGLVCVADNQRPGYARMCASGAVVGLGMLEAIGSDSAEAVHGVRRLLVDVALRRQLRERAWHLVDGHGRRRVVDIAQRLM